MDNLNDLKKIWLSADTATLPDAAEMMHTIRRYRSTRLIKKIALIAGAIFLTGIMVAVVFLYKSVMISTRLGEAFMILAGMMLVFTNVRSLGRLYRVKDHTNKEFISYLEQVQVNRAYYHKKTQVAGLLLVSAGLLLYLYEGVYRYPTLCIISYLLTALYIGVLWLVVRPRVYKRQAGKLEETIKKMKSLAKQFEQTEQ